MKYKKLILIVFALSLLLIGPIRRAIIPKYTRAWCNLIFRNLVVEVWSGNFDVTTNGTSINATMHSDNTYKYNVFMNYNIDRDYIIFKPNEIKFKGIIRYTVHSNGKIIDSHDIRSSYGWQGWNDMPDDFWSESLFEFWMPYNDEFDSVTIEMEVLEGDPSYLKNKKNAYLSIKGAWNP